jgi:hypothetical protein
MMTQASLLQRIADLYNGIYNRGAPADGGNGNDGSTSSILLISFDMASAALLIATILIDVWRVSRRDTSVHEEWVNRKSNYRILADIEQKTLWVTSVYAAW